MKWLSPANVTAFLVFSASAILNYFGSSPKILYLPAFALCIWIMYQTHAYIASKEQQPPKDSAPSNISTAAQTPVPPSPLVTPTIRAAPEFPLVSSSETPSPTPSPPTSIPAPKSAPPKPKPISSSETDLTPSQITKKLTDASPFERDGLARAFHDVSVDWTLLFSSANPLLGYETITSAAFIDQDNEGGLPTIVLFTVPTEGHKSLPFKEKTALFKVRGKIAKAYMYRIDLQDNPSIELLHD